jgi:hypothetical protein
MCSDGLWPHRGNLPFAADGGHGWRKIAITLIDGMVGIGSPERQTSNTTGAQRAAIGMCCGLPMDGTDRTGWPGGTSAVPGAQSRAERCTVEAMPSEEKDEFKRVCGRSGTRQAGGLAGRRGQAGCAGAPCFSAAARTAPQGGRNESKPIVRTRGILGGVGDVGEKFSPKLVLLKLDSILLPGRRLSARPTRTVTIVM